MSMGLEEALAINYLAQLQGQGGVAANINYVWAWIAFLTAAAISFWKIKLSSHSSFLNHPCLPSHQPETTTSADVDDDQQDEHEEEMPTASLTTSSSNSKSISRYTAFCSMENTRSGKFSMYYYDDNTITTCSKPTNHTTQSKFAGRNIGCSIKHNTNHNLHEEEDEKQELSASRSSINYFQQQQQQQGTGWEWEPVLLKMKTTEMVWYRYQDLTVLDGNVVRLWN